MEIHKHTRGEYLYLLIMGRVHNMAEIKIGRPTDYNEELAETILTRIIEGQGVAEIGRDEEMPDKSTIFRWLAKDKEFRDRYARAKEVCADYMAEELLDIADNASNDWMARNGKDEDERWIVNGEHIQRSRVRIDARKWLMGKLKPKKYGDKLALGGDPDSGPIKVSWEK
jgi:hypothetical protein